MQKQGNQNDSVICARQEMVGKLLLFFLLVLSDDPRASDFVLRTVAVCCNNWHGALLL